MIARPLWKARVQAAWRKTPIVWLTGVRRVGKAVLAQSFDDAAHFNCDLPTVAARVRDPESFFRSAGCGRQSRRR
jgi:uncharacterized protein